LIQGRSYLASVPAAKSLAADFFIERRKRAPLGDQGVHNLHGWHPGYQWCHRQLLRPVSTAPRTAHDALDSPKPAASVAEPSNIDNPRRVDAHSLKSQFQQMISIYGNANWCGRTGSSHSAIVRNLPGRTNWKPRGARFPPVCGRRSSPLGTIRTTECKDSVGVR